MQGPARASVVVAAYDDLEQAERAVDELRRFDFRDDQIGLAVCGQAQPAAPAEPPRSSRGAPPPAALGAVIGGLVGGVASVAIPGLGTLLAGGLVVGLLEGAAAGGLAGALLRLGVSEADTRSYVHAVELGRAIVVVQAEDRVEEAEDILQAYRPYEVEQTDEPPPAGCG